MNSSLMNWTVIPCNFSFFSFNFGSAGQRPIFNLIVALFDVFGGTWKYHRTLCDWLSQEEADVYILVLACANIPALVSCVGMLFYIIAGFSSRQYLNANCYALPATARAATCAGLGGSMC